MINKDRLLKYGEYLKETLDPWKVKKDIRSFNKLPEDKLTINGDLKDLSKTLTEELHSIQLPYKKLISFGGIEIDVNIIKSNNYKSNINWFEFLKGNYEITIEVIDNYDINYLISIIVHEIRHMIDFTDENLNNGVSSFDMEINLRKYNVGTYSNFFVLVYLSSEHELVARNNQIYPYIKFKNLSKEESLDVLKSSFIWEALQKLRSFDSANFVSSFDLNHLIGITNGFISDVLGDKETKIENTNELLQFYSLYDEYFSELSEKWEELLMREVDMTYERKTYLYNDNIINGYNKILTKKWGEIKKKIFLK